MTRFDDVSVSIKWEKRAAKELDKLPNQAQRRIVEAVENLKNSPKKGKKLKGSWKGMRRLRVGSYRVIYSFDGTKLYVLILRVGHRKDIYD